MISTEKLFFYLFKLYSKYFIIITIVIIGLLCIAGAFDALQKFKTTYIPPHLFWKLVFYKIPYLINEIAPLISFITMLLLLYSIIKHNELLIMLCSGLPIWKILIIPTLAAFFFGTLIIVVVNPLGAYGFKKSHQLAAQLMGQTPSHIMLMQNGIWLFEKYQDTNRIIQTSHIDTISQEMHKVVLLFVDDNNKLLKRIDANRATLANGQISLIDVNIINATTLQKHDSLAIPTNLSMHSLISQFIAPEMIPVWDLPITIDNLLKLGLPIINYQMYYYKQLLKPLVMMSMVILANCCIYMRDINRFSKIAKMFAISLSIGLVAYYVIEILMRVLSYQGLHPLFAMLFPISIIILVSNFIILHLYQS